MARYNLIQIGTEYLTSDGTNTGTPCKTLVTGLDKLKLTKVGSIKYQASGKPIIQLADIKGVLVTIRVDFIHQDVYQNIIDIFQTSLENDEDFVLAITGDIGTFNLTALPDFPGHNIVSGQFSNEILKDVSFNLRTT